MPKVSRCGSCGAPRTTAVCGYCGSGVAPVAVLTIPEHATEEDFDTAAMLLGEVISGNRQHLVLPAGYAFQWEKYQGKD